jgi:RNA polymerase sigma-70 factor (ECF subfamily)
MEDWNQILLQHADAVWRTAYRLLGCTADADDVMQEVFVDAFRMSARVTVRNWAGLLRRMATVRALDCLRRRIAERLHSSNGVAWDYLLSADHPPDVPLLRCELSDRLRWAINRLPTQHAQTFCLKYIEDMSYENIADQMQVSVNSVGVILHRARERLRELLHEFAVEQEH